MDALDRSFGRHLRSLLSARSVAGQFFFLQLALVVLLVASAVAALVVQARSQSTGAARQKTLAVGEAFANSPGLVQALDSPNPTAELQPLTEKARKLSGVDSIVVFNTNGIRYTQPDPAQIGKHVVPGDPYPKVLSSKAPLTSSEVDPLGLTVFAEVPVFRPDGSIAGIVSPEIKVNDVNKAASQQLPIIFGAAGAAIALALGASVVVGRRLLRQTHGLGPAEMTRMYEHHDAVLHSVREGVLIIGGDGRLLLANDEARRLLDLPTDAAQRRITDLGLAPDSAQLLASRQRVTDEVHLAGDRLLAVNVRPVDRRGGPAGSVATLRDTTELRMLAGRAEVARERLQLLYDAGVRIGTTLDVARTAEELAELVVPRFTDVVTVELLESVLRSEEPVEATAEMRRTAVKGVRGDLPFYPEGELIRFASGHPIATGVAGGHAVLVSDLADSEGFRAQDPERAQRVLDYGIHSLIAVPLQARGALLGMANFWRADASPHFGEEDVSLAEELAKRAALCIDNARRFTREHTLAATLQRSLLPRSLPEQSAVEPADRYLPAQAGAGGDWFDVIPLPSARVALVVGDVVGHGLHAAATMGRLRTAVHNFSALDMPPDELLSHLDELVAHIDQDQAAESDGPAVTGATCLYAVYDPVSGRCTLARSGHPGPALVRPDGTVTFPEVPGSPPLGLGGSLPFETAELMLPEGSQLVLYTDGLIEDGDRGLDSGLDRLRTALSDAGERTPEATCQAVAAAMIPERPRDDVALLVARTRRMDPDRVAEWEVASDPADVPRVRTEVARRLEAWGLDQVAFTAELIVSELVTNAVRYGSQPIGLRLLHDRSSLICEVADGSSTSPHLRRAATTDEGGRGLFLVAQFAQRWGTRYGARGKVIWTEQPLGAAATEPGAGLGDDLLDLWTDTEP